MKATLSLFLFAAMTAAPLALGAAPDFGVSVAYVSDYASPPWSQSPFAQPGVVVRLDRSLVQTGPFSLCVEPKIVLVVYPRRTIRVTAGLDLRGTLHLGPWVDLRILGGVGYLLNAPLASVYELRDGVFVRVGLPSPSSLVLSAGLGAGFGLAMGGRTGRVFVHAVPIWQYPYNGRWVFRVDTELGVRLSLTGAES